MLIRLPWSPLQWISDQSGPLAAASGLFWQHLSLSLGTSPQPRPLPHHPQLGRSPLVLFILLFLRRIIGGEQLWLWRGSSLKTDLLSEQGAFWTCDSEYRQRNYSFRCSTATELWKCKVDFSVKGYINQKLCFIIYTTVEKVWGSERFYFTFDFFINEYFYSARLHQIVQISNKLYSFHIFCENIKPYNCFNIVTKIFFLI